jgi:hypothetical protein
MVKFERSQPTNELNEERSLPSATPNNISSPTQAAAQANPAPANPAHLQIYRPGIQLSDIFKNTLSLYHKMFVLMPVQLELGMLIGFSSELL